MCLINHLTDIIFLINEGTINLEKNYFMFKYNPSYTRNEGSKRYSISTCFFSEECPTGWEFGPADCLRVIRSGIKATFAEAREYCAQQGAMLPHIASPQENLQLKGEQHKHRQ